MRTRSTIRIEVRRAGYSPPVEIEGYMEDQLRSGPLGGAMRFLEAIENGDVEAACSHAIPELATRLRSGLASELQDKWARETDDGWGWIVQPRDLGHGLKLIYFVEDGRTGRVQGKVETEAIPFVMQRTDRWRVYALDMPPEMGSVGSRDLEQPAESTARPPPHSRALPPP